MRPGRCANDLVVLRCMLSDWWCWMIESSGKHLVSGTVSKGLIGFYWGSSAMYILYIYMFGIHKICAWLRTSHSWERQDARSKLREIIEKRSADHKEVPGIFQGSIDLYRSTYSYIYIYIYISIYLLSICYLFTIYLFTIYLFVCLSVYLSIYLNLI